LLRWRRWLDARAKNACQQNRDGVSFHWCSPCVSQDLSNRRPRCGPNLDVLHCEPHRRWHRLQRRARHSLKSLR
jgi:hypothetical protein